MIAKHLDNEVSFSHYLSRRYTIENLLDFVGDEQDLLSMYLTNGFCVLGSDAHSKAAVQRYVSLRFELNPVHNAIRDGLASGVYRRPFSQPFLNMMRVYRLKESKLFYRLYLM